MTGRKAAIVTGSATGVGAATALGLARGGYDVLINCSPSTLPDPMKLIGMLDSPSARNRAT